MVQNLPSKFVLEDEKIRNPKGRKSSQIKHKRGDLDEIQTHTDTQLRDTVNLLDNLTVIDDDKTDQPCKKMRADFRRAGLVGVQGAGISWTLRGYPREEGRHFGLEHETEGRHKGLTKK